MIKEFAIFILTYGRPHNVTTLKTLKKAGYTGKIILIIDDTDKCKNMYLEKYENVEVFNKLEILKTFDIGDNFEGTNSVIYARNVCFEIAKKLDIKYFMQLDDDYGTFEYRIYSNKEQKPKKIFNLDEPLKVLLDFYINSNIKSLAMAQGGDFIGGKNNRMAKKPTMFRKCMNSFLCSVDRPFKFSGKMNDDVNTYLVNGMRGDLMVTIPFLSVVQKTTQKNAGGLTDIYLELGTYVKSFYSVLYAPSCVTIKSMGDKHKRLHHSINWQSAVPKIIRESIRKINK